MKLNEECADFLQQKELWTQVRAVIKGKYAVNEIVHCLPQPEYTKSGSYAGLSAEYTDRQRRCDARNNERTASYWSRGRLLNATARTHDSLDGMIWSNQPEVEIPSQLEFVETNADGTGCGLREVAQEITSELTSIGRYGILIDMPKGPVNGDGEPRRLTRAENESGDYSPRAIQYIAEQIISSVSHGGGRSIDEVKLVEEKQFMKADQTWETKKFTRKLIIIDGVYHNQLFDDKDELIEDITPIANGKNLDFIPFQFFGSKYNRAKYSKVTLYDLANYNLGHYVLDCENRDNLHFHGQGTTFVTTNMSADEFFELNPNGWDVGAKSINQLKQGDNAEILQIDASGAIPAAMESDEQRMIYQGAQLVQNNSTNQTLGAKEIDANASMSTLKRIAYNASSGIEQCLKWMAMFMGVNGDSIKYQLNTEFVTDTMDAQTLALHFQTVQSGLMPKSEYWEVARKAGLTKKSDEELKELTEGENLMIEGTSEEVAKLQAENDALREQLANA